MANVISDFKDEFGEMGKDVAKGFVEEVVKGIPQTAKKQILRRKGDAGDVSDEGDKSDKKNKIDQTKVDPVTGKPVVKKQILTQLSQAAAQLQIAKLKKVREELEKQRLKVTDKKSELSPIESSKKQGMGPVMSTESLEKQPKDEAVANTLKGSKNTGEFKGLIGG